MAHKEIRSGFRLKPGSKMRLKDYDPAWTGGRDAKQEDEKLLSRNLERLTAAQELLWSTKKYALLVVLQGMDTGGKDGLIAHVMSSMNPQACHAYPFKQPAEEELDHDFLWRYQRFLPARGQIGIFNRSYYEEVLVVRVHPEWLERQHLARPVRGNELWEERYQDINHFEKHLARNNTIIVKFFLNISRKEQKNRLLARLDDPKKQWKFSASDLAERGYWKDYARAYENALGATSTDVAPWHILPADHKWVTRWLASEILSEVIEALDLKLPKPTKEQLALIEKAKSKLHA
ncbi:MAG TPA: PPK2 family polyphosphate kinase [Bryobacteraceae bacterium]|nr:PPK2 family polyphosphate kinase [Bryobacteraceae bacterium]